MTTATIPTAGDLAVPHTGNLELQLYREGEPVSHPLIAEWNDDPGSVFSYTLAPMPPLHPMNLLRVDLHRLAQVTTGWRLATAAIELDNYKFGPQPVQFRWAGGRSGDLLPTGVCYFVVPQIEFIGTNPPKLIGYEVWHLVLRDAGR